MALRAACFSDCMNIVFQNRTVFIPPCGALQNKPLHWGTNPLCSETFIGTKFAAKVVAKTTLILRVVFVGSKLRYLLSSQQNSFIAALTVLWVSHKATLKPSGQRSYIKLKKMSSSGTDMSNLFSNLYIKILLKNIIWHWTDVTQMKNGTKHDVI